jgi:hypothetical protein
MRISWRLLLPLVLTVLQACTNLPSNPSTSVEYDHDYDFSRVRKIAIQPIARDTLATMLISDQQISRINGALSGELTRRGFEVVMENMQADMFLSWRFIQRDNPKLGPFDPGSGNVPVGTLYVNMIDPIVLQSKWRATFQSDLQDQPETPEAAQYRREAAKAILARFPPREP